MPALAAVLPLIARFLALVVSGLVFRALATLGFAYLTYTGIGSLVESIESSVRATFSGLPSEVMAIMGLAKVDVALNIMLTAIVARLVLAGMDRVTGTITSLALLNKAGG